MAFMAWNSAFIILKTIFCNKAPTIISWKFDISKKSLKRTKFKLMNYFPIKNILMHLWLGIRLSQFVWTLIVYNPLWELTQTVDLYFDNTGKGQNNPNKCTNNSTISLVCWWSKLRQIDGNFLSVKVHFYNYYLRTVHVILRHQNF